VDVTDGPRPAGASAVEAPLTPPDLVRPSQPVLGAALRPPLTGAGRPPRPLAGDALREALASHPAPPPPAPPTDRYSAPAGYPPSPYAAAGPHGEPYASEPTVLPPAPGLPTIPPGPLTPPAAADPAEQELWFHPQVEPAPGYGLTFYNVPDEPPARPAPQPASGTAEPVTPADPSTVAIVLPSAEPLPSQGRPAPRELPLVLPDDEPSGPVRPMSRRARRAAEHVAEPAVPAWPASVPSPGCPPVHVPSPAAASSLRSVADELPEIVDTDDGRVRKPPVLPARAPRARSRRGGGDAHTTSAIPVIRPPVQVRRPEEDGMSAAAETRSLRVTPPDAKALFRTPVGPKGTDSAAGGPSGGGPASSLPPVANVVPPAPATAPPRPVAPKSQGGAGPLLGESEAGRTRKVVVVPGAAPGSQPAAQAPAHGARRDGRAAPDPATAEWLGELRGDDASRGSQVQPGDFRVGAAPVAETVVPALGREVRQNRKADAKARKADAKARKADAKARTAEVGSARWPGPVDGVATGYADRGEDVVRRGDFADLDAPDRSRLLSLLVFWAPALILLLLAGVVIWLVR
jgi:hypothetical protein